MNGAIPQDYVAKIGKTSISCKDTPGFVVNRLLVPFIAQAMEMVQRGDATAQDIDIAMRLGTGHPMGPLHLSDYVGQDTMLFVLEGWKKNFPNESAFIVPENLRSMIAAGNLGRKTGKASTPQKLAFDCSSLVVHSVLLFFGLDFAVMALVCMSTAGILLLG